MAGFVPLPLAGMPSLTLTDLAEMRLQSISFFLVLLLASAWGIKLLWNGLRRDFPRLPWLGYRRALALVTLWGFLFVLVLTMIGGARELMTPGAWEKQGLTYRLKEAAAPREGIEPERWSSMERLKAALWAYAEANEGTLPESATDPAIDPAVWESPDLTAAPYRYYPGQRKGGGRAIIAAEPALFGSPRLVLRSDGTIEALAASELKRETPAEGAVVGGGA